MFYVQLSEHVFCMWLSQNMFYLWLSLNMFCMWLSQSMCGYLTIYVAVSKHFWLSQNMICMWLSQNMCVCLKTRSVCNCLKKCVSVSKLEWLYQNICGCLKTCEAVSKQPPLCTVVTCCSWAAILYKIFIKMSKHTISVLCRDYLRKVLHSLTTAAPSSTCWVLGPAHGTAAL